MWESLFKFLFKFRSLQYGEGEITFYSGNYFYFFLFLLVILIVGFYLIYKFTKMYPSRRTFVVSLFLRSLAAIVLFLPLLEPVLLVPDVLPKENFLVVLADKSASMSIDDGYFGKMRDDDVNAILYNNENAIIPDLDESYKIRYYSFGANPERVDSLSNQLADESSTHIYDALKQVIADFKGLPLSGIVLFSDGNDNSLKDQYDILNELRGLNIPLHVVGLGNEIFDQERELLDIATNKSIEEGAGAEIDVQVRSWMKETDPVTFKIFKGDQQVFSESHYLKGDGKIDYFTFFYEPVENDAVEYSLSVQGSNNEVNNDNNSLNMLIDSQKDTMRVLYFEGQLRNDFKFIKRALERDPVIQFTSVSRTSKDKFYRQNINNQQELSGGFPNSEEELYKFKAIIFGDVESSFFTYKQLNMIEKFVRLRGGGFLMLGGSNSFSESDYWNSPLADILPIEIDLFRNMESFVKITYDNIPEETKGFKFVPTREGLTNPILKLASERNSNRAIWNEMPVLTSINYFGEVKPGAQVLAKKMKDDLGDEEPLLVVQRYGKGRSAVLGTSSTWRWKLLVDAQNNRHERFWRQMARWLVTSALDNVSIDIEDNVVELDKKVPVRVSIFDDDFTPIEHAQVNGILTDPLGQSREIILYPELSQEGEFSGNFIPKYQGVYKFQVNVQNAGKFIGSNEQSILVRPSKREFYDATLKRKFLQELASQSGGFYYNPSLATDIPLNLKTRKTDSTVMRTEYIWDMPFIFLVVIILLSIEWFYRRRKGLP